MREGPGFSAICKHHPQIRTSTKSWYRFDAATSMHRFFCSESNVFYGWMPGWALVEGANAWGTEFCKIVGASAIA